MKEEIIETNILTNVFKNIKEAIIFFLNKYYIDIIFYFFIIIILCAKYSYYFSDTVLTGWDTIGHNHFAKEYLSLFKNFDSLGYDLEWFQGMPAFYFYPPFFYFLFSHLYLIFGNFSSVELSFNLMILITIIFFAVAYIKFVYLILKNSVDKITAYFLIFTGLIFYFLYPGSGPQGLSIVGIINGTFVSTFGHGMILFALYYLERYRSSKNHFDLFKLLIITSLIFYTHFLSSVFLYIIFILYFIFFFKELDFKVIFLIIIIPLILSLPISYNFLKYKVFNSSTSIVNYYPGLLSVLGKEFYDIISNTGSNWSYKISELIFNLLFINIIFVSLYAFNFYLIFKKLVKNSSIAFFSFVSIVFLSFSIDTSLSHIFKDMSIHWYRAFDLFFIFFTISSLQSVYYLLQFIMNKNNRYVAILVLSLVIIIKFFIWSSLRNENYKSIKMKSYTDNNIEYDNLEKHLSSLKKGSLIFPEILRTSYFYGSPHWLDYVIQKAGHRNALGLMIESSLTPLITHAYIPIEFPQIFVWGIDIEWKEKLYKHLNNDINLRFMSFINYLQNSGIDNVITQTESLRAFLKQFPKIFKETVISPRISVFEIIDSLEDVNILIEKPYGFVDYNTINNDIKNEDMYKTFLLYSNQTKLMISNNLSIINLNPYFKNIKTDELYKYISGLIIFNSDNKTNIVDHTIQHNIPENMPIFLVNFKKSGYLKTEVNYLSTKEKSINNVEQNEDNSIITKNIEINSARIPVKADKIDGNKIILTGINEKYDNKDPDDRLIPVEIKISYFPDWRTDDKSMVFQTDLNQMIVYSEKDNLSLYFKNKFKKVITLMMYILSMSFVFVVILRKIIRA